MSKFIDYYKILGISKDTPQSEIKAAYRKRSKQFHPDLHPDDPKAKAKFQLVNEAYEVLSDPDKRARYDQYGEHWNKMNGAGGYGGQQGGADPFGGFNPFGNGGNPFTGGGNPFTGGDGASFEFNMNGGGFSDFFTSLFGEMAGRRASSARNSARTSPAESQAAISVDMYTAILGGEVIIESGNEKLKLKLKAGTQPGSKLRLKGKGGGGKDLILTINVELPTNLSQRQKELLMQMQQA